MVPTRKSRANPLQQYEDLVGGRQCVVDVLSLVSDLDKRQQKFLQLLADPLNDNESIVSIAAECGISAPKALDVIKEGAKERATSIALGHLHEAVPGVALDIIQKAIDNEVPCPSCRGAKVADLVCQTCMGHGTLLREGDIDHKKMLLEVTGVLKKNGGLQIQMNQNVGVTQPGSFFSRFVRDTDATAYDVEAIDVSPVHQSAKEPASE